MNNGIQNGKQSETINKGYNPHSDSEQMPFNPFEESNEFVQNDFG